MHKVKKSFIIIVPRGQGEKNKMENKIINFTEEEKNSYKLLRFEYQRALQMARNGNEKMLEVSNEKYNEMIKLRKQIAKNHGVEDIGLVNYAGLIM